MVVPDFLQEYKLSIDIVDEKNEDLDLVRQLWEKPIDLDSYIQCKIKQVSDGYVPIGDYSITLVEFTESDLLIQFDFKNPLHASVGRDLDSVDCSITDSTLFISKESSLAIEEGTNLMA